MRRHQLIYFADLTDLGLLWRSKEARPWVIFHLTPAIDKLPRLEPYAKVDMVKHFLFQTIRLAGPGFWLKKAALNGS